MQLLVYLEFQTGIVSTIRREGRRFIVLSLVETRTGLSALLSKIGRNNYSDCNHGGLCTCTVIHIIIIIHIHMST